MQAISTVIGKVRNAEEPAFPYSFPPNLSQFLGSRKYTVGRANAHITITVPITTLKCVSEPTKEPITERTKETRLFTRCSATVYFTEPVLRYTKPIIRPHIKAYGKEY